VGPLVSYRIEVRKDDGAAWDVYAVGIETEKKAENAIDALLSSEYGHEWDDYNFRVVLDGDEP
jgi:hypothetical protein